MTTALATVATFSALPPMIRHAGDRASFRFVEFFTANIRNRNTRAAYSRAVAAFCAWCEERGQDFVTLNSVVIAGYVEQLLTSGMAKPTVKQHLAAIRMLFDYMVTGSVLPFNPAASVRGPKYVVKRGKTPVLKPDEARALLDSIDTSTAAGLRDRALIAVMVYSFARVSAVVGMDVDDYYQQGKRWWLRLAEKGGKAHAVPVHHKAEEFLDAYLAALGNAIKGPLFRAIAVEVADPGAPQCPLQDPRLRSRVQGGLVRTPPQRILQALATPRGRQRSGPNSLAYSF
jgi:integrase/recombinase XerD